VARTKRTFGAGLPQCLPPALTLRLTPDVAPRLSSVRLCGLESRGQGLAAVFELISTRSVEPGSSAPVTFDNYHFRK
jgi:hypothetical protein